MATADTTKVSGTTHDSQISDWTSSWLQSRDVSMGHESSAGRAAAAGYPCGMGSMPVE